MKDFKKYLKNKLLNKKKIVGKATLTPPDAQETLQSSSSLAVLDLLAEGPIEGLVAQDGKYANGLRLFESFYLNKIPVKAPETVTPLTKDIPYSNIVNVSRVGVDQINKSLDNIASRLSGAKDFTSYTGVTNIGEYFRTGAYFRESDGEFEVDAGLTSVQRFKYPLTQTAGETGFDEDFKTENSLSNDHQQAFVCLFRPTLTTNYQFKLTADDGAYFFLGPAIERNSRGKVDMFFDEGHGTDLASAGGVSFTSEKTDGTSFTFNSDDNGYTGRSRSGIMIRNGEAQGATARFGQTGLEANRLYPVLVLHQDNGGDDDLVVRFRTGTLAIDGNGGSATADGDFKKNTETPAGGVPNIGNFLVRKEPQDSPYGKTIGADTCTGDIFNLEGLDEFGLPLEAYGNVAGSLKNNKLTELQGFKSELENFLDTNSGLARFGFAEYDINNLYSTDDLISGRISKRDNLVSLATAFDFENVLTQKSGTFTNVPFKRQIKIESDDTITIPDDIHFIVPLVESGVTGSLPNGVGKVENMRRVSGFAGGGIFFFEIGDTDSVTDSDKFNTGRFFVDSTSNVTDVTGAITSGITGNYDVFVYDSNSLSLESATPTQITPIKGLTDGSNVKIGMINDLKSTYNYSNVSLSFRHGYETQPVLDGYEQGTQDFEVRKELFGPLLYKTGAEAGAGYQDLRTGGQDFSNWMINPPLEHDSYPHTHIIKREEVDECYPTISINALYDTLESSEDAGKQLPNTLKLRVTVGFEGAIGTPGDENTEEQLEAGNSIEKIALKNYTQTFDKTFTSLVLSTYMTSITDNLDYLPSNESLKNLRVDQASVGSDLTDALVAEYDYTSGDLLFPGETWKNVNRFVKIEKLDSETDSVLMARSCSISYFTEVIKQKFIYPYSAIAGSNFDARSFTQQPSREFDVRLKKVLIPSNYEPLNPDGTDKRFVDNSSIYGRRSIFKFDGTAGAGTRSTNAGLASKSIKLGPHNFEISLKIKFGDVSSRRDRSYHLLDMQSVDAGSSNLNDDRLSLIQRGKTDGGDNDTDVNPQLVLYSPNEGDTNIDIPAGLSTSIVYQIKIKRVGDKLTLSIHNYATGALIGESSDTGYSNDSVNYDVLGEKRLAIGQAFNLGNKTSAGTQIADLIIKKNNEIINWWDGTIIDTIRGGLALRDKVGGSHADLANTPGNAGSVVEDTTFEFGKNKSTLYNGHWDGTFKLGWTDNPAWILYDLMINPIYGIGNTIDDREDINIFRLFELARYCDAVDADGLFDGVANSNQGLEPRFSANVMLGVAKNAYEVLGNIASIFRAISFWDGASLNFNIDRPKEIAGIFNNGNVFDGVFNYADVVSSARFTRVEVPYADADDQFVTKVEYVEDEERIRKYGVITSRINGIGCSSKSQARRMAKYVLLSNKLETELVTFQAGNESLFLEPGDIIRIDDELKNFEINYGRILEINTGTPGTVSPYFVLENQVNPSSIIIGESAGGLYTYSNPKQRELENLYDTINYDRALTFGNDGDTVTGKVPISVIEDQNKEQVSKFHITGVRGIHNGLKVLLNSGNENFSNITGVQVGNFFNVELNNQITGEFKVVKISPEEDNLYQIHALQYERKKFDMIEAEDFDLVENTYNIGIPAHTVSRPTAPTFNFEIFEILNGTFSVTGDINAAGSSDETSYRVTVLKTDRSSPYLQKVVERSSDDSTPFRINGLINGDYTIRVNALKNPESSNNAYETFSIAPPTLKYVKSLIENISSDVGSVYDRVGATGYGTGQSLSNDTLYNLNIVDKYSRQMDLSLVNYSLNIYAKSGENYNLVKENHKENQYTFTEVQNRLTYGQMSTGFELRFELIQNEKTIDTSYYKTIIT